MHAGRRHDRHPETGFTLIELLVVIAILGILSAIVVFSVAGVTDRGASESSQTEVQILRTAEAAYCAQHNTYATQSQLITGGLLADSPGYHSVVEYRGGPCGGTGYVIGSTTSSPSGSNRILAAANNTPGFQFLSSSFQANTGDSISFLFGASGTLATTATGSASNSNVLFASADEANVNKTYTAQGSPTPAGALGDGKCTPGGTTFCNGIATAKTLYTIGRLAIVSCKAGSTTLSVSGAPTSCPVSSKLAADLSNPACNVTDAANALTPADVSALLGCDTGLKLVIASPGSGCSATLGGTSVPTAPYGCAAEQALTFCFNASPNPCPNTQGGTLNVTDFQSTGDPQIVNSNPSTSNNVTSALTTLRTGAADLAMVPLSFEESPGGDDTNNWSVVADGGANTSGAALHDPIKQWAIVLRSNGAAGQAVGQDFLTYVTSVQGQAVLAEFGYCKVTGCGT